MDRRAVLACLLLASCYTSHDILDAPGQGLHPGAAPAIMSAPGASDGTDVQLQPLSYYRDVKPILDEKCGECHVQDGMGPFPLTSYGEVKPLAKLIRASVEAERMPPWRAAGPLDKYLGDRRLSPEQKRKLLGWIDQGTPEGSAGEASAAALPERRGLPRIDSDLPIPEPFTPLLEPDHYRCFVLEWPHAQTKYITGLSIEPDQKKMVHHAIVYLVEPENALRVREKDASEPGPGYDCLGVDPLTSKWLTSYEPGGFGQENPGGAGFEVRPGSLLVLQMHYNTLGGKTADRSHVQLMLADRVERVGSVSLIINPLWYLGLMRIPANQPDVVHRWQGRPSGLASSRAYDLHTVDLHMHTLGHSGSIGIVRAGASTPEPLLEIPSWAFEWQETFRLKQPVRFQPGDQLYVECRFDNTAENQLTINGQKLPVRDVNWGEGTSDEMCLGNVLATPAL